MRQFDSLARQLARGDISRRRCLRLIGGLGAAAGLTTLGVGRAIAQEDDPLTISGQTVSQLRTLTERQPNPQAFCARFPVPPGQPCFLDLCSTTCPEGLFGAAVCLQPAGGGNPRCAAAFPCEGTTECSTAADCGPRQFCARTCCPGSDLGRCATLCPENQPSGQVPV